MTPPAGNGPTNAVALVTGVSRRQGIGFAVAERLARDGFDVGFNYWTPYDQRMSYGADAAGADELTTRIAEMGRRTVAVEVDLEKPESTTILYDSIVASLGPVAILVMCHCESVDSGILDTTEESFNRHFAVNSRATWLLIREFGIRYQAASGYGRVISLTSDATVGNLPYGASKGALDRITLAAAQEFAGLGITANVINPGPTDTGWMTPELKTLVTDATPLGRLGVPNDVANLVSFLCSSEGGWINGQLLSSNGGLGSG
ncbi:MAG TPA: SDR family oxidoreductase [Acidimicrobiales bacterium]|nr:SDR family oxidoreductase [Acidimicrobiales bacterium]